MRKICVITGTRAEYGLLHHVLKALRDDPQINLCLIATGTHLSPEFGLTYQEIEEDGFKIDRRVEILLSSDTGVGVSKSVGLAFIGLTDAINELLPDLVVILGDRFELLAAAASAVFMRIPVVHLHGGEVTEGAWDDSLRHAITKLSNVHCVATEAYRRRVIQLGENPRYVYCIGGLGVDAILRTKLYSRAEIESELGFEFKRKNLLITFHPATNVAESSRSQLDELLAALEGLSDTGLIFTMPNADSDGRLLGSMIEQFTKKNPNACWYHSLGFKRYISCLSLCDGVVRNSSSGLLEAPTLRKGTVNISDRQRGRVQASSIINCAAVRGEIREAIAKLYSDEYKSVLKSVVNPYGEGGASSRIVRILKEVSLEEIRKKTFFDFNSFSNLTNDITE